MISFGYILRGIAPLILEHAHAGILPSTPCGTLIGCGGGTSNVLLNNLPQLAFFLLSIASGLAVLFIVYAGFRMVIDMGDESKMSQHRMAIFYSLLGITIAILSQRAVSFVGTQYYGQGTPATLPVSLMATVISIMTTLLNAILLFMIIIGGLRMVYAYGKTEEYERGKKVVIWSLIGAIVVNLANALVHAIALIFGV